MQKALTLMNLQLHHVVSDVIGVTGMKIVRAIVAEKRDAATLAACATYVARSLSRSRLLVRLSHHHGAYCAYGVEGLVRWQSALRRNRTAARECAVAH